MFRVAKMPGVAHDKKRDRGCIQWWFPVETQHITGKWFRFKFRKGTTPEQAAILKAEKRLEFEAMKERARQLRGTWEETRIGLNNVGNGLDAIRTKDFPRITAALAAMDARNEAIDAENERMRDQLAIIQAANRLGIKIDLPAPAKVYRFATCINDLWIPRRRRDGRPVDDATVEKLVGSKVRRLITYLGHDDMERVTRDDLETYIDRNFETAAVGTIRDHIVQLQSLFNIVHERGKITHNPAKLLHYSRDNDNPGRPFLPSERIALIRAAWTDCDDETVKWLWLLGCFYGPRIAEFAEASLRDIVVEDGVPIVFLDKLHRKGRERTLKTSDSQRWLPIHSAMREAFIERVTQLRQKYGEDGPLFPDLTVHKDGRRNKSASLRVNAWVDAMVADEKVTIADAENKTYHSLRHTISTALQGRKWADFITGHARVGVKRKVYLHPPLDEVVADIETLAWPIAPG